MTARQDPYRVLGLVPGATPGEIRSAYRRLAKLYHPDAAGDRAVARFLAIQAAYEALLDDDGRLRAPGWPGRGGGAGGGRRPSSSPRASRDAWRARRDADGTAEGPKGKAGGANGQTAGAGPKPGPDATPRGRRAGSGADHRAGARPRPERKTARPGSTTYDEAAQPLDPAWDGATWYGASSGRYWTLNPREYADPRKHGPEYQERARRAARLEAARRARAGQGTPSMAPKAADPSTPDGVADPPPPARPAPPEPPPPPAAPQRAVEASAPPPDPAATLGPSRSSAVPGGTAPAESEGEEGSPVARLRRLVRRPGRPAAP